MRSLAKPVLKLSDLFARGEWRTTISSKGSANLAATSACEAVGGRIGLATDASVNGNRAPGGGWGSRVRRYYAMSYWKEAVSHGDETGNQAACTTMLTKPPRA